MRGIEVSEDAPSLEAIRETCLGGPNHFLGSTQTLARMQSEYLYPVLGDRSSPKEWEEKGRPALIDRARRRTADILRSHFPTHVPRHIDAEIRERFPVRLAESDMRPPTDRDTGA